MDGKGLIDARAMAMAKLDTLQNIELAEGVQVLLRPAGPIPRGMALLIDAFFCGICVVVAGLLATMVMSVVDEHVGSGVFLLLFFIIYWGYFMLFEVLRRGQTPGKRMCGLRVVRTSGARVQWGNSFLRNLVRFADMMPMMPNSPLFGFHLFGLVSCVVTSRFQRLGDLVADTLVIYEQESTVDDPARLRNPVNPTPPPVALTREEQQAFMQFLERASLWSDARKEEMIASMSEPLGAAGREGVGKALSIGAWVRDS
jgi:uncharacterized RDD family membrane protein YckC